MHGTRAIPRRGGDAADEAMDRYAAGEDRAFDALYDALAPRLMAFLRRHTRDRAESEDLLQQTLLQIHRGRASYARGARVVPWALSIARRLVIDAARRARRRPPLVADGEQEVMSAPSPAGRPDEWVESLQTAARVERELARMPELHRAAFELVRARGLSTAEAAEALGTTSTAVKLRVHRACVALRAAVEGASAAHAGA